MSVLARHRAPARAFGPSAARPNPARRRILVVDDEPEIRRSLTTLLLGEPPRGSLGELTASLFGESNATASRAPRFRVDVADQGDAAVSTVERARSEDDPIALAFVDMRMPPGIDGVETTAGIWTIDPAVQIVIWTAWSDFRWDEVLSRLGRSDGLHLLRKPFDPQHAITVAEVLTTKWGRLESAQEI